MRRRAFTAACALALLFLCICPAQALDEPRREAFDLSGVEQAVPPEAQQALKVDLPRRGGEDVPPAHDLGHAAERVIHDDGELVAKQPV